MCKLLKKKVVVQKLDEKGDFFSSVFLRFKKWELQDGFKSLKTEINILIVNTSKVNHYIIFCIWSSQGTGWLLWILKIHTILSLSMRNTKILKISLAISFKIHSYA